MTRKVFQDLTNKMKGKADIDLVTILARTPRADQTYRIYSSNDSMSPEGEYKSESVSDLWRESLLDRSESLLLVDFSDMRSHLGDADQLIHLGIGSVLNVPVMEASRTLAVINILGPAGALNLENHLEIIDIIVNCNDRLVKSIKESVPGE
ncbi:hypothetical protein NBM05_03975 [Rothia sp. AR01]|uniref:GAF domain-containing protein n=1 Tax=Rothia santali TaxID=2949643 RepID=A0A9X2HBJ9_9MICC|nr:hypothetical protein [Rothia santali]MCP3425205.1 hypothetical protein [Rothia santali]